MLNWKPDFSHVILEMCLDAIVMGTNQIGWPAWLVDQVLATYHDHIHLRAEIWGRS